MKLANEAELRAFRSQMNPHFLFNALNTVGYLIEASPHASQTLLRLSELLRAAMGRLGREFSTLGEEIDLVEAYVEIEKARFEERLQVRIQVPRALLHLRVPALLLQPLIENAVKHGVQPSLQGAEVLLQATLCAQGETIDEKPHSGFLLHLTVADTGVGRHGRAALRRPGGGGGARQSGGTASAPLRSVRPPSHQKQSRHWHRRRSDDPGAGGGNSDRDFIEESRHRREECMSEKVRVVIADDERPARLYLTKLLQTFQEVELLGEAENGPAAVELIKRTKPDLALLDLQMPGLDGLAVARSFQKEPRPLVVFVTAHDKFAVSAFEVEAFDFLLKPIDRGRLRDLFRRAMKRLELIDLLEEDPSPERAGGAGNGSDRRYLERIPVKQKENILLLPVSQIASIVADGELLYVTTVKRERYCINHRLKSLERRLDPAPIHPSRTGNPGQHSNDQPCHPDARRGPPAHPDQRGAAPCQPRPIPHPPKTAPRIINRPTNR
ncbi:MAG: histidine kinase [Candidatus Manganitrophus sp.]|nr:MAG: histidine kinase [Candidatus Manganitrophus sp.]